MAGMHLERPLADRRALRALAMAMACAGLWQCTTPAANSSRDIATAEDGLVAEDAIDVAGAADAAEPDLQADAGDGGAAASDGTDSGATADAADADVACPPHRVPLVKGDVVVDPCGCCEIKPDCTGYFGGSPWNGICYETADAAPPCYETYDKNGCKVLDCAGSCLTK